MDALMPSQRAPSASPYSHSAARSLSLPTPSPSPSSCSEASSTSSSRMLSFGSQSDILDPLIRRIQYLSVSQPSSPPSYASSKFHRHRPPPLFCPTPPNEFLPRAADQIIDLRYGHDVERPQSISSLGQRQYEEFRRTKSRVIRVSFSSRVIFLHTTYCVGDAARYRPLHFALMANCQSASAIYVARLLFAVSEVFAVDGSQLYFPLLPSCNSS